MSISPLFPEPSSPVSREGASIKDFKEMSLSSLVNNLSAAPRQQTREAQNKENLLSKLVNTGISENYLKNPSEVAVKQLGAALKHIRDEFLGTA